MGTTNQTLTEVRRIRKDSPPVATTPTGMARQLLEQAPRGRPKRITQPAELMQTVGFEPERPGKPATLFLRDKLGLLYTLQWDESADALSLEVAVDEIPTRHIEAAMLCQYPHAHDGSAINHTHEPITNDESEDF